MEPQNSSKTMKIHLVPQVALRDLIQDHTMANYVWLTPRRPGERRRIEHTRKVEASYVAEC